MIHCTHRSPTRRALGRFSVPASLVIVAMIAASAGAGSIFDDNWTPPKSTERPRQTVPAAPTATAPAATPDTPQPKPAPAVPNQPTPVTPTPQAPVVVAPTVPARLPIPAKADLARSRKLLREAYGDVLNDRSFKARRSLVRTLLDESDKPGNSPSDRFALLAGAIDAAKESESLPLCFTAADKLAEAFDVDGLKVKSQAATSMVLKAPSPAETAENARADLELADQLAAAEDFAAAARVVALARPLAADNPELRDQVLKRSHSIDLARSAFDQVQPFLDKLKTAPNDAAANLALGIHYCLKLGQWDKGLAYLAKGSDAKYKELATAELAAPTAPADALIVAAGWWDRALQTGTSDADAKALKLHAATWYRFGQSGASGLAGKLVETRLNQAALLGFTGGNSPVATSAVIAAHSIGHSGPPGTIDLLRLVDVQRDVVEGTWTMGADGLKSEIRDKDAPAKIRFPYDPPPEYDLNIELTRLKRGHRPFTVISCLHGSEKYLLVFGENNNRTIRISGTGDRDALRTDTGTTFVDNRRCKIRVEMRKEKLAVYLDDKLVASCVITPGQGDNGRFWWVGDHVLGFGAWNSFIIHSVKLTEIGQSGTALALGPAAGLPPLPIPAPTDVPSRVVNLMPLIDLQHDAVEGNWEKLPGGAFANEGGRRCRIRIPYQPPDEYDFRIVFHRIEGDGGVAQMMPLGGKSVLWFVGGNSNTTVSFEFVAGRGYGSNATSVDAPNVLETGRQYTSIVHVRRGRICVSLDGKLVSDYKTNGSDLSIGSWWDVGNNVLGIGADPSRVQFDAIEIREIRGVGKVVGHPELPTLSKSPPDDSAQRTVDLMPLIDPAVDTVGGRWSRVNKTAIASDGSAARLRIPYHPPDEYDFHVRLHRTGGGQFAALILSHGLHNFHFVMGAWDNRISGLELVDGRRADNNPTTIKSDAAFENGREVDLVAYVRNGSVAISVDGKLVLEHKTNYADLTVLSEAYIGDGALGLYTNNASFQVDAVEIREITGEGKPSPRGQ
jgi:hypothetical protein